MPIQQTLPNPSHKVPITATLPWCFDLPVQAQSPIRDHSGAMLPPVCLEYGFHRWPVLTYCTFKYKCESKQII